MPERTADSTFGEYVVAWAKRIRYGESGVLPVVAGLILLVIIFQVQDSVFLSAGNLTNLLVQGSVFVLLGHGRGVGADPRRDRPVGRLRRPASGP